MNDEGEYMFKSYRDEWIPDTPSRRRGHFRYHEELGSVLQLESARGHSRGHRPFYDPNKKISLYVYSDDFAARLDQSGRARDRSA